MLTLTPNPLVSIVIPAYKADYFEEALSSACSQTYDHLEIVVGDDNCSGEIRAIVDRFRAITRVPINYFHNQPALGEIPNMVACIQAAGGKYIKTLHDDDELLPECVAELVEVMERNPSISLASSRRVVINEAGQVTAPDLPYLFPFAGDVLINGPQLVAFLARHPINFVGEPSCMLCRREDLLPFGDQLMSLQGKLIIGFGDMAMAARLFQHGNLALLARPLTRYRVSQQQLSHVHRPLLLNGQGQRDFTQSVYTLGWAVPSTASVMVDIALMGDEGGAQPVDLYKVIADNYRRVKTIEHTRDWLAGRLPSVAQQGLIAAHLARQSERVRVGIMVLDDGADPGALLRTLTSIEQHVACAQVQVLDAGPADGNLTFQLNALVLAGDSEWLMLIKAGETFTPAGWSTVEQELPNAAKCAAVYADYVSCDFRDELSVGLRPDFNLDFLLSHPAAMAQHWLFRRGTVLDAGGFADGVGDAREFDMILRMVNQLGVHCFGHIPEPLVVSPPRTYDDTGYLAALGRHLLERGYAQAQIHSFGAGRYAIDYGHLQRPLVSIVVVAGSGLLELQRCVMSVMEKTRYRPFELVIVATAGGAPDVVQWLSDIELLSIAQLRIVRPGRYCTASDARNLGGEHATGEFLLFLSAQAAVFDEQWLEQLLNHGLRPEVGVVGGKSLSADGTVTHAGLMPGVFAGGGRVFFGVSADAPGYLSRLLLDQNYSAVTHDCLLVRTALFREVAGFDDRVYADEGADVDLCLRLVQQGYLVVWAPRCVILNECGAVAFGVVTQQRLAERWLPLLARDPASNANFSLDEPGGAALGALALNWRPLLNLAAPVVLAQVEGGSSAAWHRLIWPLQAQEHAGMIQAAQVERLPGIVELERFAPQVLLLHGAVRSETLGALRSIKTFSRAARVYELDVLPETKEGMQLLREVLAEVDRVIVGTPMMAQVARHLHGDVRLVESRLDPAQWLHLPIPAIERPSRPRVGWVGSAADVADLAVIAEVILALSAQVDWVIQGPCPLALREHLKELRSPVPAALRAQALVELDLDLALVPLAPTVANEFKGPEALLEFGACGYSVICSETPGHRGALPVTRVGNTKEAWLRAIGEQLSQPLVLRQNGQRLREVVRSDWMHDADSLSSWRNAWLGQ